MKTETLNLDLTASDPVELKLTDPDTGKSLTLWACAELEEFGTYLARNIEAAEQLPGVRYTYVVWQTVENGAAFSIVIWSGAAPTPENLQAKIQGKWVPIKDLIYQR